MKLNHTENTKKFAALLGSEQRAKAAQDALAAKLGTNFVTIKTLHIALRALEGHREFASQPEGAAILEIVKVMGPPAVIKPSTIPTRTTSSAPPPKPLSAKATKEKAFQLLEEFELLNERKERIAFFRKHRAVFEDADSGISEMALRYLSAGKDLPAEVRAGLHFSWKTVGGH